MANYSKMADKLSAGLSGATAIGTNVLQMSKAKGLNGQQLGYLQDINSVGMSGYGSYDQAIGDYQRLGAAPSLSFEKVRGMNTGQKVGNVFTDAATGAMTGLSVAGPWGALGGAVFGTGAGVASWVAGDNDARMQIRNYGVDAQLASTSGKVNADAGLETLNDVEYYSGIGRRRADGGAIERKQMTLQQFTDKVLHHQRNNDVTHSAGIIRQKREGGVCIRIKRK